MPAAQLPGGAGMPRFQTPFIGASQRMAVSPGREEQGYFHMPGGQSGHPFSPHYRDANPAWVRGEATPFVPGPNPPFVTMAAQAIGPTGNNSPHNNMMPYLTLNFCIALQGVFPPRG